MDATRVVITGMPGPTWWDIYLQWGVLLTQAAAAIATVAAVYAALYVARQQERRERAREEKIGVVTFAAVGLALGPMRWTLGEIYQLMNALVAAPTKDAKLELQRQLTSKAESLSVEGFERVFEWLHTLPDEQAVHIAALIPLVPAFKQSCASFLDQLLNPWDMGPSNSAKAQLGQIAEYLCAVMDAPEDEQDAHGLGSAIEYWRHLRVEVQSSMARGDC